MVPHFVYRIRMQTLFSSFRIMERVRLVKRATILANDTDL